MDSIANMNVAEFSEFLTSKGFKEDVVRKFAGKSVEF